MSVNFLAGVFFIFAVFGVLYAQKTAFAANSDIVINEIGAYEPSDHEWIEIYNKGSEAVDMTGWFFHEDATNHGLSVYQGLDMIIEPGEYAIIADRADYFQSDYPLFSGTIIDSSWSTLSLSGELIELRSSATNVVESFTYVSSVNSSLERANPFINDYSASNWQTHASGNTVGVENSNFTGTSAVCGNGELENGEECDDGNTLNGDSCSSICQNENGVEGNVSITITPASVVAQNISPAGADIVFQTNGPGKAWIKYSKDVGIAGISEQANVSANIDTTIALSALECGTLYYFAVYVENDLASESDQSDTATFTTLPCGITINSIVMSKTSAKANDNFANGWEWNFDLTAWDMEETKLKMMFNEWTGPASLSAVGNMRFSVDNGMTWIAIDTLNDYSTQSTDISGIAKGANGGRNVTLVVQMKVPSGTLVGQYNSGYGIKIEQ